MLQDTTIAAPDAALGDAVRHAIDVKTKPPGSLGRIEALALQMALAQGTERPLADPARLFIFAGDHGIVAEGVSAWPQEVTAQMVLNFLAGGAASTVFARANGAEVTVVDAGVATELADAPGLVRAGIRKGTRNAAVEDALTGDEVGRALAFGAGLAGQAVADGARVIALGEMGIGNTSAASLIAHAVAGIDLGVLVGPGAGLDANGVDRKLGVLAAAAARRPGPLFAADALAAFGGLEIAAMAGALIGAASRGAVVLVDGFIATAAALAALAARPEAKPYCVFAHRSKEPGHVRMLDWLGVEPLIDLDLRLGEGTGALLALPLLRSACAMLNEMATFESAGVSGKDG
ncbi:MAG: nicotinate-nucleotide--dimethylbenzimidazole phosphoribosyltransferase [Proteobacteria bacterium]|nr:nicotinate-nucleotide--dimethylbenzimidazole phosphoribosyltransferase [Pseudomonadota bacterium]